LYPFEIEKDQMLVDRGALFAGVGQQSTVARLIGAGGVW
jgi:hypothetical protein